MEKKNKIKKKNMIKDRLPGLIMIALLFLVVIAFLVVLIYADMLPMTYVGIILLALMILILLDYILVMKTSHKIPFVIGTILFLGLVTGLGAGGYALFGTISTLHTITNVKKEITEVNVYVSREDPAENLSDVKGYSLGILKNLDRDKTDAALEQIRNELGSENEIVEYDSLTELADFVSGDQHAMLLNGAYLAVFDDLGGYDDFSLQIRKIATMKVETELNKAESDYSSQPYVPDKENKVVNNDDFSMIYISGIDTAAMTVSRSDVNILAAVNKKTHQVLLISTPRDYFVPLSVSDGIPDKLTHAGIYGVNVSEDTLGMLYETGIDYYFRINFTGFVNVIDSLGGISVYSDYTFDTGHGNGAHFEQGWNNVNGEQALAFCRERKAFAEGDRQRGKNQMAVVNGVINKALSPELLKNYLDILNATTGCFESDIPYSFISDLVKGQLEKNPVWSVFSYSVDGTGDTQKPYSMSSKAYVMIPDQSTVNKAKELIGIMESGEYLTDTDARLMSSIGG